MQETTYTQPNSNQVFNLREISQVQLIEYFVSESREHIKNNSQRESNVYLNTTDNTFTLTYLWALYHGHDMAAFCIIPKYSVEMLMRIYVSPKYRRLGLATFLINHFKITNLSCLKENVGALLMYEKLGFEQCHEHTWLVELKRSI